MNAPAPRPPSAAPVPESPAEWAVHLELTLRRMLDRFPVGEPAVPVTVEVDVHGTAAVLRVGPSGHLGTLVRDAPRLTTCERQVLRAVQDHHRRTGGRIVAREVRNALAAAGIVRGRAAIQAALTEMVNAGVLVNDKDKRGYGPAEGADEFMPGRGG